MHSELWWHTAATLHTIQAMPHRHHVNMTSMPQKFSTVKRFVVDFVVSQDEDTILKLLISCQFPGDFVVWISC